MDPALHALNRFGLGARPGERGAVGDARGWVLDQLEQRRAGSLRVDTTAPSDATAALRAWRSAQAAGDAEARRRARRQLTAVTTGDMRSVLTQRLITATPVLERLAAFWTNHLCISIRDGAVVAPLAGWYESEAIRPHVLGRFEDMVLASASHPAMLLYLDNAQSVGPASQAGRVSARRGGERGLNENYARELLELHTLGVDGGYTQQDVQELARILTGWTVAGLGGRGGAATGSIRFMFDPRLHEPGGKVVLGVRYANGGQADGRAVIRDLCRHPSTARFVATRLVRHFIADEPPPAAVAAVAEVFRTTEGDLRLTMRALVERDEAWSGSHRKFRAPQDWLVAVLRALSEETAAETLPGLLRQLRHPLWSPAAPNGFGDTVREWADPDSLLNRAELARTIARRVPDGFEPQMLLEVIDVSGTDPLRAMMSDRSMTRAEQIALAIASPAFQWR